MWVEKDKYHMTNGIYTISKNISRDARVTHPYGLHKGNEKSGYVTIGFFKSSDDAKKVIGE